MVSGRRQFVQWLAKQAFAVVRVVSLQVGRKKYDVSMHQPHCDGLVEKLGWEAKHVGESRKLIRQ